MIQIEQTPKARKYKFGDIDVSEACIYTTENGEDLILRAISPIIIKGSCITVNAFVENTGVLIYVNPNTEVLLCNLSIEANEFDPASAVDNQLRKKFGLLQLGELCFIDGDERAFVKTSSWSACPILENKPDFQHPCSIDEDCVVYVVKPE